MPDAAAAAPRRGILAHLNRVASGHLALSAVLVVALIIALVALDVGVLLANNPSLLSSPRYYLALGESLSFGYQPNLDFADGFVDDVFADLHAQSPAVALVNYACAGETSLTMIQGNCPAHLIHHNAYSGPQLTAAVNFLRGHSGRVAPITLGVGSNDLLPDWDTTTCSPVSNATADLARLDASLTQTILPQLTAAVSPPLGTTSPNFLLLNYYNPFARACPGSAAFIHQLNDHLAADAAQFHIPVVDVYNAFGGDAHMADNLCIYTWVCDSNVNNDIHPTTVGYHIMAQAVEQALGIPVVRGAEGGPTRAQQTGHERQQAWRQHDIGEAAHTT